MHTAIAVSARLHDFVVIVLLMRLAKARARQRLAAE